VIAADGVWPVMLTPFLEDRKIDWRALDELVEWYLQAGVSGLFAVCLSSEMYELEPAERIAMAERVVARAAGRVPVIASGTFGDSPAEQADAIRRMAASGVAAVVYLVNALAGERESEDVWRTRAESLFDAGGETPIGLYECPLPYHRVLTAQTLAWAAGTGRFGFIKETSGDIRLLEDKLAAVRNTALRVFNAHPGTLLRSLRLGAAGFCGISANFVPELWVWLCRNYGREADTSTRLESFLLEAERCFVRHYPASAKRFADRQGIGIGPLCRIDCGAPTDSELRELAAIAARADAWRGELGID
jgi:4-hydroxy-tetrahydrodipicolinate synthase